MISLLFSFVALYRRFIEPLTDNEMITVNSSTPVVNVTCRLSDPIPSSVTVQWLHNGDDVLTPPRITSITSVDTAVLQIRNFSSFDVGVYQCVFNNDPAWTLSRSIRINTVFGKLHLKLNLVLSNLL